MDKPEKPYDGFPLFAHQSGQWAKKIRGQTVYFGLWADWQAALQKYLKERDALQAGLPRAVGVTADIRECVNRFLTDKQHLVDTSELSPRTFATYRATGEMLGRYFGPARPVASLCPADFLRLRSHLATTRGVVSLGNEIQRVRSVFNHSLQSGLIDEPVNFGPTFRKPSRKSVRKARRESGAKMFEAVEIRRLIESARQPLLAMIYLGLNCGFGQFDVASLTFSAVDLDNGWVTFPRPKTEIDRRCPLWPETLAAVKESLTTRPAPRTAAENNLLFVTKYGNQWVRIMASGTPDDGISKEFRKLTASLGLTQRGRNFYTLRHVFETIGGESRDQVAVNAIMGHADQTMAAVYRERISDERLIAVTETVRQWLLKV